LQEASPDPETPRRPSSPDLRMPMTRLGFSFAALALAAALPACNSPSAPEEQLEVVVESGIHRPAFQPPFAVRRTTAQLTVDGTFETLCAPTALVGEAHRDGDVLVVAIAETPTGCSPATEVNMYTAIVSGFVSAPSRVRVVHRWPGTNQPDRIVFEGTFD
jgi:hypothetical protein